MYVQKEIVFGIFYVFLNINLLVIRDKNISILKTTTTE
jgi:hypothetical protein